MNQEACCGRETASELYRLRFSARLTPRVDEKSCRESTNSLRSMKPGARAVAIARLFARLFAWRWPDHCLGCHVRWTARAADYVPRFARPTRWRCTSWKMFDVGF